MKNKRTILFPKDNVLQQLAEETSQITLQDLLPGKNYKIGPPSALNYQFINATIFPDEQNTGELENLLIIQGMTITVISIIRMVSGDRIAVLRHNEDQLFLQRFEKIFAQINMAVSSGEIIALDTE